MESSMKGLNTGDEKSPCPDADAALLARIAARNASRVFSPVSAPPKAENESPCPNEDAALLARLAARNASGIFSPWPEVPKRPHSRGLTGGAGQLNLLVAKEVPQRTTVRAAERKARDELKKEFQSSCAMHQEEVEKKVPRSGKVETIDQKSSSHNIAEAKTLSRDNSFASSSNNNTCVPDLGVTEVIQADAISSKQSPPKQAAPTSSETPPALGPLTTFFRLFDQKNSPKTSSFRKNKSASVRTDADHSSAGASPERMTPASSSLTPAGHSYGSFGNFSCNSNWASRSIGTRPSTIGLGMDW